MVCLIVTPENIAMHLRADIPHDQELRQTLAEAEMHRDEHQAVTELATQREEAPLATACFDPMLFAD